MNTPDQTIELVKKWLDNPESVSKEELEANRKSAKANYDAPYHAYHAAAAAAYTTHAAYAVYAYADAYADAKYWVTEYEKLLNKRVK